MWLLTEEIRPYVQLGHYVIMPDHIHGIVKIIEEPENGDKSGPIFRSASRSLGAIVRGFKGRAAREINSILGVPGCGFMEEKLPRPHYTQSEGFGPDRRLYPRQSKKMGREGIAIKIVYGRMPIRPYTIAIILYISIVGRKSSPRTE